MADSESTMRTDILSAAQHGTIHMVRQCVRIGQPVNTRDQSDWTPLHFAAKRGDHEMCSFLIGEGASVDARTKNNLWTCLHEAATADVARSDRGTVE